MARLKAFCRFHAGEDCVRVLGHVVVGPEVKMGQHGVAIALTKLDISSRTALDHALTGDTTLPPP